MKRLSLLLAMMAVCSITFAGPVTKDQAKQLATQFLQNKTSSQSSAKSQNGSTSSVQLNDAEDADSYYIFNIGNKSGFVVVSSDDRTESILGYSDSGSFDVNNVPDNMKAFLKSYTTQIENLGAVTTTSSAKSSTSTGLTTTREAVAPMVQTLWGQGAPYYYCCPKKGSNYCVTGCVATSMAQVLYYNQYPTGESNTIPEYTPSQLNKNQVALPATTFDWNSMQLSYTGSEDSTSAASIAKLMHYCGQTVRMDYGPSWSSAQSTLTRNALVNYFGYDASAQRILRSGYTISEWDSLIYNEISNKRPVIYDGDNSTEGHSFVCDGYDGNDYYHFNWGWNGLGNGYFKLSVMNPFSSGMINTDDYDGYTIDQDAIIGIQPKSDANVANEQTLTTTVCYITDDKATKMESTTATRNSSNEDFTVFRIQTTRINNTFSNASFDTGIGLYKDGKFIGKVSISSSSHSRTYSVYESFNTSYRVVFGNNLADGTYTLIPICKLTTETEWRADLSTYNKYVTAVIKGNTMTSTNCQSNLTVNSLEMTGNKTAGSIQEVTASVTNNGIECDDVLYLSANNSIVSTVAAQIKAGATSDIVFHYIPTDAGTNVLKVSTDYSGSNIIYTANMDIASAGNTTVSLDIAANVYNTAGNNMYGNSFKTQIVVKNNGASTFNNNIRLWLYNASQSNPIEETVKMVNIKTGGMDTLTFEYDNLDYESTYYVKAAYTVNSKNTPACKSDNFTMTRGMKIWDADGNISYATAATTMNVPADATAICMLGATPASVTPSENPNCLYLLDENASIPTTLENKNVIKDTTAENITIEDGYPFLSPINFTANNINYSRTFEKGADGKNNWSTIVLPFKADKVMNVTDNKTIDWFHGGKDTDKNFWIDEFKSDSEGSIYFDYVNEIQANKPYIIAVPGNKWGEEWNLVGKVITFSATDVEVISGANNITSGLVYDFVGSTKGQSKSDVFTLNDDGNRFGLNTAPTTIAPFRAYFESIETNTAKSSLAISIVKAGTTDLQQILSVEDSNAPVYNLSGIMVGKIGAGVDNLEKGIYIINGKKIVR